MRKWISLTTKLPAKAHEALPPARDEFARKVAAFRKATGVLESCAVSFKCAKTHEEFEVLFQRAGPSELFAVASITIRARERSHSSPELAIASVGVDISAFDLTAWVCPCCGVENFTHFSCCNQNLCHSNPRRKVGAITYGTCKPGCGSESPLESLKNIDTCAAPRGSGRPKHGALEKPKETQFLPRA